MKFIDNEIVDILHVYKTEKHELQKRTRQNILAKREERVEKLVRDQFENYSVANWTDYEDLYCLEFRILLTKNQPLLDDNTELLKVLGGTRIDLTVFVSLISNHYYLWAEKTRYNPLNDKWTFQKITLKNHEVFPVIEKFTAEMERADFKLLPEFDARKFVPDVETKYLDKGKVRVFHIIFTDMETL
ncbi:hypothetical protein HNQ44_003018 [Planomicrobium koreense]|uniref:Uncharacterized protein n=1 Tax=Planococcus koreensis TaxID=112331 RepID=A0A7W8FTZ0_9BACL|nr:hypothetical protein [Planococcus koreensis]MBB5181553.1 hypothetical protein [Planococcus koreensis]